MFSVDLGTVGITALVTSLMQLATWFLFRRQIDANDAETKELRETVNTLKINEIEELKKGQAYAAQSRKNIHQKIDAECVKVAACTREHAHADERMGRIENQVSDTKLLVSSALEKVSNVDGKLDLICRNLNITMGGN